MLIFELLQSCEEDGCLGCIDGEYQAFYFNMETEEMTTEGVPADKKNPFPMDLEWGDGSERTGMDQSEQLYKCESEPCNDAHFSKQTKTISGIYGYFLLLFC